VADSLGYKDVNDYRGGIKEWADKGLPTEGEMARSN
jgi:rhodanese-related sulfurtransferase